MPGSGRTAVLLDEGGQRRYGLTERLKVSQDAVGCLTAGAIEVPSTLFDDSPGAREAHVFAAASIGREVPLIETIGGVGKDHPHV